MPEISIITTFYDAVDYLPLTVKAILDSTFTDFELLLIDDGGPNDCGKICDILAETDPRIRVFHKKNGGPASAANVGLKNARGRYIATVDSDDIIEPTMLETLYRQIQESGCPMAACAGDCIDGQGNPLPGYNPVVCSLTGKIDALELFRDAFSTGSFYGPLSWNKLIDIRLFRDRGILYDEKMFYGDDASVLHRVFEGQTIYCTNEFLYHYRSRQGSMTALTFNPRKLDDLTMYYDWVQFFAARPQYQEIYRLGLKRFWQVYYLFYHQAVQAGKLADCRPAFAPHFEHLKELSGPLLAQCGLTFGEKLRLRLFLFNPALAYNLARLRGNLSK